MRWLNVFSARLRALSDREAVLHDIDEEMRLHLEMATEANVQRGMAPAEARRAALSSFGHLDHLRDTAYGVRGGGIAETLWQDIRYGVRVLAKQKGYTAVAVLTLALGIGANTSIFSVVHELLVRPLPYADPERIVTLWELTPDNREHNVVSAANFLSWSEQSTSFESMAAFSDQQVNLTGEGEPEEVALQIASPELFKVLGVDPLLGRVLSRDNDLPDTADIVLSHGFWQRRFGGDPKVIGRRLTLNGSPGTVVGVMPPGFQWHVRESSGSGRPAEMWAGLVPPTEEPGSRGRWLSVAARLKRGVSVEQAQAEMNVIAARLEKEAPQFNTGFGVEVVPLREQMVGNLRPALLILLGAVGFVLLIACANVANLALSHAAAREKEIALRTALGARRPRIVRQLLTESVLLALLGSLLGLGLAWCGIRALVALSPSDLVNLRGVGLDLPVLGWTLAVTVVTGLLFGLTPALEGTRLNLNNALKEGGQGAGGQGARGRRLRSAFVVAEVALALVLMAGAGLLVKSFVRLQNVDIGFDTENVLTMTVRLPPGERYAEDPQILGFFRDATERIRSLANVRDVGMVNYLPFYGGLGARTHFTVEGRPEPPAGGGPVADVRVTDRGYFGAMGIPLLRGRNFTDVEVREARRVVLISQSLARQVFPNEDPIGKRITVPMSAEPAPTEIIGIVGDVRYESLTDEMMPTVYMPMPELLYRSMTFVIRTQGDPMALAPVARRELRAIDPNQPVSDVRSMETVMADTVGRPRFNTLLFGLFAGLATLLAAIGIFGVMRYSVALRTREIGLRMALGAQPGGVLRLMLGHGLMLTLLGLVIGLAGALVLTRLMSSLLFGVEATDPATFAAIVLLLAAVSLIACYIPARRATRIDPLRALRYE